MSNISEEMKMQLDKARDAAKKQMADRVAKGLPARKTPAEKAAENPTSMRAAINAKCEDCIYDPCDAGTWQEQVRNCTDTTCALHGHRLT